MAASLEFSPAPDYTVGQTVTVTLTGAPHGKNYITLAIYPGDGGITPNWAARKTLNGDGSVDFVLGQHGQMYAWADDNADLGDGELVTQFVGNVA